MAAAAMRRTVDEMEMPTGSGGEMGGGSGDISDADALRTWDRPPVDLVHLARHTLGDRNLEREVLRLFLCQSKLFLERVAATTDAGQRGVAAHSIKGSARGIGAWEVARCAEMVEGDCLGEAPLSALKGAISDANAYIDELLDEA